jgi:hypothetical protein
MVQFNDSNDRDPEFTMDFQELKIQEFVRTPRNGMIIVHAEKDLVQSCCIGNT